MDYTMIRTDDLVLMGYRYIISIDPETGYGSCILPMESYPKQWDPSHFPYDDVMAFLIEQSITEEDILTTIEKMRLSTVLDALSRQDTYRVYYACIGENDSINYRKASFIRGQDGNVMLFLIDSNDEALAIRQANVQLQNERNEAIRHFNIASRMLHLLDRDFRTHLFSINGLTDMMMEENMENDKDSPHFHRADRMIEQMYLTGHMMLESLNDMRELKNLIRWDETLQEDLISIDEMLSFFDEPLLEQCEFHNTVYTWDVSGVEHLSIVTDETILSSLLLRLIRYIISNSSMGGFLQVEVKEMDDGGNTSVYTFSITCDRCNLSMEQLTESTMSYQGLFKEMQKNMNAMDFNLLLLKKYTELLDGSYSIREVEEGKQIDLSFRFKRGDRLEKGLGDEGDFSGHAGAYTGVDDGTGAGAGLGAGAGAGAGAEDFIGEIGDYLTTNLAGEKTHSFESTMIQGLDTRASLSSPGKERKNQRDRSDKNDGGIIDGSNDGSDVQNKIHERSGQAENKPAAADPYRFSGKTALVIDDNLINLEVTSKLLRNTGFLVVDVEDGQKGIATFIQDQGRFDVIILDIRMPGLNGIDVARRIRASGEQGASIPIIALTANDRPEERQQSIDAGMNDHLSKPVNPYLLYSIIEKYVK